MDMSWYIRSVEPVLLCKQYLRSSKLWIVATNFAITRRSEHAEGDLKSKPKQARPLGFSPGVFQLSPNQFTPSPFTLAPQHTNIHTEQTPRNRTFHAIHIATYRQKCILAHHDLLGTVAPKFNAPPIYTLLFCLAVILLCRAVFLCAVHFLSLQSIAFLLRWALSCSAEHCWRTTTRQRRKMLSGEEALLWGAEKRSA